MHSNVLEAIAHHFGQHTASKCSIIESDGIISSAKGGLNSPIFSYNNDTNLFTIYCSENCTYYCNYTGQRPCDSVNWKKQTKIMDGGLFLYEVIDCKITEI
jgi:hypothetical protein